MKVFRDGYTPVKGPRPTVEPIGEVVLRSL